MLYGDGSPELRDQLADALNALDEATEAQVETNFKGRVKEYTSAKNKAYASHLMYLGALHSVSSFRSQAMRLLDLPLALMLVFAVLLASAKVVDGNDLWKLGYLSVLLSAVVVHFMIKRAVTFFPAINMRTATLEEHDKGSSDGTENNNDTSTKTN